MTTTPPARKRTPPRRTTVRLELTVEPEVRAHVEESAARFGLTMSEYVSAVVTRSDLRAKPAVEASAMALAGHRTMVVIETLQRLLDDGEDVAETLVEVRELRREIVGAMRAHSLSYDVALDARPQRERIADHRGELE